MKREQIEAEFINMPTSLQDGTPYSYIVFAQHIAKLAVEQEREQCAVECDYYSEQSSNPMNFAENCAKAIRARGNE